MDKRLEYCIVLEMERNLLGRIIAWASRLLYLKKLSNYFEEKMKDFSHIFIMSINGFGFESTFPKVRLMKPKVIEKKIKNKNTELRFYNLLLTKEEFLKNLYEVDIEDRGKFYPVLQLIGSLVVVFNLIFKFKKIKNPFGKDKVCSEEILSFMKKNEKYKEEYLFYNEDNENDFTPLSWYLMTVAYSKKYFNFANKEFGKSEVEFIS